MWQWLADNPKSNDKEDWPGWDKYVGLWGCDDIENHCFACEYVSQIHGDIGDCGHGDHCAESCPLLSLWGCGGMREPEEDEYNESHYCENSMTSPYMLWRHAPSSRQRRRHALKIAGFCEDFISEL
jgi:hypothetical protein